MNAFHPTQDTLVICLANHELHFQHSLHSGRTQIQIDITEYFRDTHDPASLLQSTAITLVVIIGRFIWIMPLLTSPAISSRQFVKMIPASIGNSRLLHPGLTYAKRTVSLAVALIIPPMSIQIGNADLRDLIIFLVFCIIIATLLLQGLTLPWIMKLLGIDSVGSKERSQNRHIEIEARLEMANAVLRWLEETKSKVKDDPDFLEDVRLQILDIMTCENT